MAPLVACSNASFQPRAVGQKHLESTDADLLLTEARAQFRAGNHALAAGSFRRVLARSPESVEAFNGMAAAYDRLGRFDLARRYYEEGLALAPHDRGLRTNYAAALRAHGLEREAGLVDLPASVEQASAPSPVEQALALASETLVAVAPPPRATVPVNPGSVTIMLPEPVPTPLPPAQPPLQAMLARVSTDIVLPEPARVTARSLSVPVPVQTANRATNIVLPEPTSASARSTPIPVQGTHASATILLPEPAPAPVRVSTPSVPSAAVQFARPSATNGSAKPAAAPVRAAPTTTRSVPVQTAREAATIVLPPPRAERVPRLERSSLGEVALITRPTAPERTASLMPISRVRAIGQQAAALTRTAPGTSIQRPAIVELRILNGVGRRGQAGRMGDHLRGLGWAQVSAGDAIRRPARSFILAAPVQVAAARRLASQLPFRPAVMTTARSGPIRLVLGADAVRFDLRLLQNSRS